MAKVIPYLVLKRIKYCGEVAEGGYVVREVRKVREVR